MRLGMSMRRVVLPLAVLVAVLAAAPLAQASDASLTRALKVYEGRLTRDIGYLANFSVPSRTAAAHASNRLSKIGSDLRLAKRAATTHSASTSRGRRGRALVRSALRDATTAVADARACATAAGSGKRSAAKLDRKHEQTAINKAIVSFEAGGKLLHLF